VGRRRAKLCLTALGLLASACAWRAEPGGCYVLGKPYQIDGRWYRPAYDPDYSARGLASWYGEPHHGSRTANGEIFDQDMVSAAHPTLPLPSRVRVTNLDNGRRLAVRVNDRGPLIPGRIIDLSRAAARRLGFERHGIARVQVDFLALEEACGTPPRPSRTPRPA
jgi:rare lipoprotein A